MEDRQKTILIRCDGSQEIGLGHVVRCMALAEELRDSHGCSVTFATVKSGVGTRMIIEAGYPVESKPTGLEEGHWLNDLIADLTPNTIVMDFRTDLDRKWIRKWRESGVLIVDIDDPTDRRLEADLLFYPPVPQVMRMSWERFEGELFSGWEWVILRRQFARKKARKMKPGDTPVILITMGGSDPKGTTLKTARALDSVRSPFKALFVVGSAYQDGMTLDDLLGTVKYPFEVKRDVGDMAAVMAEAEMAVASFGVTAYELAVMGVPAMYLCLTEDHFNHAQVFADAGIAVNLGLHDTVTEKNIQKEVEELLTDRSRLNMMGARAHSLTDGQGVERIAEIVCSESVSNDG